MRTIVVDASVAAKWYFPESGQIAAARILTEHLEGGCELVGPDLLESEFANLLWKKVRRGECSGEIAVEILSLWEEDRPPLIRSTLLVHRALDLALRLEHPLSDCLYIATAIEYEAALATADVRLQRLARGIVVEVIAVSDPSA